MADLHLRLACLAELVQQFDILDDAKTCHFLDTVLLPVAGMDADPDFNANVLTIAVKTNNHPAVALLLDAILATTTMNPMPALSVHALRAVIHALQTIPTWLSRLYIPQVFELTTRMMAPSHPPRTTDDMKSKHNDSTCPNLGLLKDVADLVGTLPLSGSQDIAPHVLEACVRTCPGTRPALERYLSNGAVEVQGPALCSTAPLG